MLVDFIIDYILTIITVGILLYLYYLYIGFCKDIYSLKSSADYLTGETKAYYDRYSAFAFLPYRIVSVHDEIKYYIIYMSLAYGLPELPDYQKLAYPKVE